MEPRTIPNGLCHLSSPAVTRRIVSNLPPDSDGPSFSLVPENQIPAQNNIGVHGLATRSPYGCRHCCRHRWALTPPFHPYLAGSLGRNARFRRSFSVTDAQAYARLAVSPVRCPVLPGLSSPSGSPEGAGSSGRAPLLFIICVFSWPDGCSIPSEPSPWQTLPAPLRVYGQCSRSGPN